MTYCMYTISDKQKHVICFEEAVIQNVEILQTLYIYWCFLFVSSTVEQYPIIPFFIIPNFSRQLISFPIMDFAPL